MASYLSQYPSQYLSWGRYFTPEQDVRCPAWRYEELPDISSDTGMIPYGQGRSYGDVCLNDRGVLVSTENMDHFVRLDASNGILSCESGVTLAEILALIVPKGWFLPVTPGTKHVSVGGAIANDVHGKNHHKTGTFGKHLRCFELLRSDGQRLLCDRDTNTEYFNASIGGLGLTGLITWAEIQLKPITSDRIEKQSIKFANLDEFIELSNASDSEWEYTVAWLDCMAKGKSLGRGIFYRGNHATAGKELSAKNKTALKVPVTTPSSLLNNFSIRAFNALYYNKQTHKQVNSREGYDPFFYPLDGIEDWNKLYGKNGFFQFQCVVPDDNSTAMQELLEMIATSGQGSFLSVLKKFGNSESPGMLSFPRPGLTLALDFPNKGQKTLDLLKSLEAIVVAAEGAIYPAKDATMSAQSYQQFYPGLEKFKHYLDPKFSSSFWRRVNRQDNLS